MQDRLLTWIVEKKKKNFGCNKDIYEAQQLKNV